MATVDCHNQQCKLRQRQASEKKENRDQSSADVTMFNEQQRLALRALRAAVKACDDSEHRQRNLY